VTPARIIGLCVALALQGCAVTEVPPLASTIANNTCEDSSTCGGGRCSGDICVAGSGTLDAILLEVTPTASTSTQGLADLAYYTRVGGMLSKEITLSPPVNLRGRVVLSADDCTPTFIGSDGTRTDTVERTIPVRATFTPNVLRAGWADVVQRIAGLPSRTYRSFAVDPRTVEGGKHEFSVWLPPGFYDVYIEPLPTLGDIVPGECQIPPRLLLRQEVKVTGTLELNLGPPTTLSFPIRWPTPSLDHWTVQVIDETSGRILSARSELVFGQELDENGRALYQASVKYVPVQAAETEMVGMLVRLVPPVDSIAPTVIGALSVIAGLRFPGLDEPVGEPGSGGIALSAPLPAPVKVEGQSVEGLTTRAVPAAVTLTATRLEGMDQCCFGSFVRSVQADEGGLFSVVLPPGDYLVDAYPTADSSDCTADDCAKLAAVRTTWQVGATPEVQAGKVIAFPPAPKITGTALSAGGSVVSGASVRANSSPFNIPSDLWNRLDGRGSTVPSAIAGLVEKDGTFVLSADPGVFDLFVQPDPSTRFAWYVRPLVPVSGPLALGRVTLPLPVPIAGRVSIEGSSEPTASALIRAYVFLTRDGEYTATPPTDGAVVQIAETRTDDAGNYELLIPAGLDSRPVGAN